MRITLSTRTGVRWMRLAKPIAVVGLALLPTCTPAAAQPQGASATKAEDGLVRGPGGERLIPRHGPRGRSATLVFRQIARSETEGKIVNSDRTFNIARLPATFAATLDTGEVCTATLIGPRVLLTAAHCIDLNFQLDGVWQTVKGRVTLANGSGGKQIKSCEMAPAYTEVDLTTPSARTHDDFALCELSSGYTSVDVETISLGAQDVASGKSLLLAGYGCTNSDLVDGAITRHTPNKGILNVGMNTILHGGAQSWIHMEGKIGGADAILCPGDSGGAAYANASLDDGRDAGRRVVAVNSAVGPAESGAEVYRSYLAPLADSDFLTFVRKWQSDARNARKICGIDINHPRGRCRR